MLSKDTQSEFYWSWRDMNVKKQLVEKIMPSDVGSVSTTSLQSQGDEWSLGGWFYGYDCVKERKQKDIY